MGLTWAILAQGSILTGEASPFPQKQGSLRSAHCITDPSRRGQPLKGVVSGPPTLAAHSHLALGKQPFEPVSWVASHKDQPQGVHVVPGLVLASLPWGGGLSFARVKRLPPGPRPPVGGSSWLPLWGWGRAPGCSLHQRAAPRWAPEHRNTWKRTQPKSGPGPLAVGIWSWIVPRRGAVLSIIWSITESLGHPTRS